MHPDGVTAQGDWTAVDLRSEARRALLEGRHADADALLQDLPGADIHLVAMRALAAAGRGRKVEAYGLLDRHLAAAPHDFRLLRAKQSAARLLDDRPMVVEVLLAILNLRHDLGDSIALGLALKRLPSMPSHDAIWRRLSRGRATAAHRRTMATSCTRSAPSPKPPPYWSTWSMRATLTWNCWWRRAPGSTPSAGARKRAG